MEITHAYIKPYCQLIFDSIGEVILVSTVVWYRNVKPDD